MQSTGLAARLLAPCALAACISVLAACGGGGGEVTPPPAQPAPRLALFAGNLGGSGNADGVGADARFNYPTGVTADGDGNLYVADRDNFTIRRIDPTGRVTTFAGSPGASGTADGAGAAARFAQLSGGLAADGNGNVYVIDNTTVRKITPAGMVSTWAGMPGVTGSADGPGSAARFGSNPRGLAADGAGNVYIADTGNHTIRRITPAGVVSTLAGAVGISGSADGSLADARFSSPSGVAVDGAGNVYVADPGNHAIRRISPAGRVTTLARTVDAGFGRPVGAAIDSAGNVYAVDGARILRITPAGVVSSHAGASYGSADGAGAEARFGGHPFISFGGDVGYGVSGVATDRGDNVYVADTGNHTIRRITPAAIVSTVAGTALQWGRVDGVGAQARFGNCIEMLMGLFDCAGPAHVATDTRGNVYVADQNNGVRKLPPHADVSTAAAGGTPVGVAIDDNGNIYATNANRIVKITPEDASSTLAGSWETGSADGPGASARFNFPRALAADRTGSLYIADTSNSTIRRLSPAGIVTTLAGTAGQRGNADGIGAEARFGYPEGIAADNIGHLYVADTSNHTIRTITPAGVVGTLAGAAGQSGNADGTGAAARFNRPRGLAIDSAGNVYVADSMNHIIRKVTPVGVVSTVVGVAGRREFVPGALPGAVKEPHGVAIVGTSLFISMNNGVAVVTNAP